MMNTFKKLYRDYFGLNEAITTQSSTKNVPGVNPNDAAQLALYNKELEKTQKLMKGMDEEVNQDLDEAQLLNRIADYRGGIEYVINDPMLAQEVQTEIEQFATKKGIKLIKKQTSKTGKVGYFLFRLGENPAKESQKLQGYISQMPQIKHFRFNVKGQKKQEVRPENPSM